MLIRFFIFLAINFGALALGAFFTKSGVASDWYQDLNKAPWTPPGFIFGIVWSLIMAGLAFFMARETSLGDNKLILAVYALQLVFNVGWNPVFFSFHEMGWALLIISLLTIIVFIMMLMTWSSENYIWLMPYFIWLVIATSLNYYSWAYN